MSLHVYVYDMLEKEQEDLDYMKVMQIWLRSFKKICEFIGILHLL